jgi:polyhydroxybutyrate depolymerase
MRFFLLRRVSLAITVLAGLLGWLASSALGQAPEEKIKVGEVERSFVVHLPKGYDSTQKYPVVVVLHSTNQDADDIERLTRFDELADRDSVIAVYPNALHGRWNLGVEEEPELPARGMGRRGGYGRGGWPGGGGGWPGGGGGYPGGGYPGGGGSGTGGQHQQRAQPADDLAFFNQMLDQLRSEYAVDGTRIYATGLSDGGFMDVRLGCAMADRFAAIAPVGAEMPKKLSCLPSRPMPVFMINGTSDPVVKYSGGHYKENEAESRGEGLAVLSAEDSAKYWAKLDNCGSKPEHTKIPAKTKDGMSTEVSTFEGCHEKAEVVLYSVKGGGNTWPGGEQYMVEKAVGKTSSDFTANEVIWNFFVSRHLAAQSASGN